MNIYKPKHQKKMRKFVGHIGIDSGQVVICDPCYIDSEWRKEEFDIKRRHRHTDGTVLEYGKDFSHYDEVIPKYGKSMNQINEDYEAVDIPDRDPSKYPFSYNACCKVTLGEDGFGQLKYAMGHDGVAVVSSTGYGDGMYPVFAEVDEDGHITRLIIDFIEDEE